MHLRRALLLFAIVIGLAALASSVTQPPDERRTGTESPRTTTGRNAPTAGPGRPRTTTREVSLDAARRRAVRLEVGVPATVAVEVDEPAEVEIPSLGLSSPALPLTPAHFDLLPREPGRHAVRLTPAGDDETRRAGTLVVAGAEPGSSR